MRPDDSAPDGPRLTVFVVDDDADVREAIALGLARRGYLVETHGSARAFLSRPNPGRPGCLVLDYGLPGMNGLELQRELNRRAAEGAAAMPVIFISGHGAVPEAVQAIKGGAVDFLEKPFRQSVLAERIETAFASLRADLRAREALRRAAGRLAGLTAREREIVAHMVARPAEISSKEIAAQLGISPRTVDHHRARILEKTAMHSAAELIAFVQKHGLD